MIIDLVVFFFTLPLLPSAKYIMIRNRYQFMQFMQFMYDCRYQTFSIAKGNNNRFLVKYFKN